MERIRSGEESALDGLIQRYWTPLVDYAAGFVCQLDVAEDIVQDTFVRIWAGRATWTATGVVRAYLYRTVRNRCLNERARWAVRDAWAERERLRVRVSPTPSDLLQERDVLEALEKAVQRLPERRREVFTLIFFHGLTHREAADAMGVAIRTVYNQLNRAVDELREALASVSDHRI
jgi:RNA polymerase sigma-70 factor, ECF subfamily